MHRWYRAEHYARRVERKHTLVGRVEVSEL